MVPGIVQRHVLARDGTRIGYQVRGEGPAVVFANGLGGTYIAYRYLYDALGGYKTVCWDYRGLYTSAAPGDPRANVMADHIDDLFAVLEAEQVDQFVVVGWSMGVQLALELVKCHRARVRGVLAINGSYGRLFRTVVGARLLGQVIPMLLRLVRAQATLVGRAAKRLAGSDALIAAMVRVGLASETIDRELFRALADGFGGLDWAIYSDLLTRLDEHDCEDMLSTIDIPVTIISGDRDLMTPPATAEHMHRLIPGSRLVVIKGGTHYTPVEYPGVIVEELGRLLDRVAGWERKAA
jgi:pimeloyl-ACP methyl ester carboxylesterase